MGIYKLELEIKSKAPSLNQLLSKGWKFRHFAFLKIKNEIKNQVSGHEPPSPLKKFKISVNRCATKRLDFDNCVASLKPVIDGLVMAGVIFDDTWDLINNISIEQTIGKVPSIKVTVEEL